MEYDAVISIAEVIDELWRDSNVKYKRKSQDKIYCHYTDLNGFLGIFKPWIEEKEKKCILYAGNIRYMNDFSEYNFGMECIENIINMRGLNKDIKERVGATLKNIQKNNSEYSKIYTISFCGDDDLLSQWKYYGKDSGIAIEFDLKNCEWSWMDNLKENTKSDDTYIRMPSIDVIYNNHQNVLAKLIRNYYNEFRQIGKNHIADVIVKALIPICKDKYFEEERETRTIFWPINGKDYETKIKYRTTRGLIVPYFECSIKSTLGGFPVKSIVIGPGMEQNRIFNAVIQIVEGNDAAYYYFEIDEEKKLEKKKPKEAKEGSFFKCDEDNKVRIAYKSRKGIIIKKSEGPFRG